MEHDDHDDPRTGPTPGEAQTLLRSWRRTQHEPAAPDALQIAAWLDGRLDPAQAQAIEQSLAHDPALLRALLAARQAPPVPADAEEIAAARGLVQAPWGQRVSQWLDRLRVRLAVGPQAGPHAGAYAGLPYMAAAAVLMATAGAAGFLMGANLAGMEAQRQTSALQAVFTDAWSDIAEGG